MTAAKQDLIEEGRSEGEKLAHGLALAALSTDTPAVLKVAEVRRWVAMTLGREIDKTESELRLRKAMLAAGMKEPPRDRNGKVTRVKIDGLYHNVVATFDQDVV
jgi:hypothetical protein